MSDSKLAKSLYQAFQKALGSKQGQAHAADHIAQDIIDPNMVAEAPSEHIPASKESVLHKDVSPAEIHQQKQAQAEAKLGTAPKMPAMKKVGYGGMMVNEEQGMEGAEKGIQKLKKFMDNFSMKKNQKGINIPVAERNKAGREMAETRKDTSNPSHAGMMVGRAKDNKGTALGTIANEQAKNKHKEVLGEMKEMPKPKLPK